MILTTDRQLSITEQLFWRGDNLFARTRRAAHFMDAPWDGYGKLAAQRDHITAQKPCIGKANRRSLAQASAQMYAFSIINASSSRQVAQERHKGAAHLPCGSEEAAA